MRASRSTVGLLWPGLGLAGSAVAAAGATGLLSRRPVHWWWQSPGLSGHSAQWHVFWAGIVLLCAAWAGLGWRLRAGAGGVTAAEAACPVRAVRPRDVAVVAALWALPLLLAPALFSLDMYSYLAQGSLLAHGENPYRVAPIALHHWASARPVLHAVSNNWQHTTAPYGPVFLALASLVAWIAGPHVTLGVTLMRLLELPGLALLAVFVPRLARHAGADPARAVWLAAASPLTLLYLIGGGHNDALMIGLVLAGTVMALERRPLAGIALCALAATIKLPGAAGIGLVGACWLRAEPARWRAILASSGAVVLAVALAAGAATGVGLSWISGSLFSTPAAAKNTLTPATDVAVTLWGLAHGGWHPGVQQAAQSWENVATDVSAGLVVAVCLWLLWRARRSNLARSLGLVLLAGAVGGPALWPWYLTWGFALLACEPRIQRVPWLPVAAVASAFAVMAGGQVAVALPDAPRMLAVYAVAGLLAAGFWIRRRRTRPLTTRPHVLHRASLASPEAAG